VSNKASDASAEKSVSNKASDASAEEAVSGKSSDEVMAALAEYLEKEVVSPGGYDADDDDSVNNTNA